MRISKTDIYIKNNLRKGKTVWVVLPPKVDLHRPPKLFKRTLKMSVRSDTSWLQFSYVNAPRAIIPHENILSCVFTSERKAKAAYERRLKAQKKVIKTQINKLQKEMIKLQGEYSKL